MFLDAFTATKSTTQICLAFEDLRYWMGEPPETELAGDVPQRVVQKRIGTGPDFTALRYVDHYYAEGWQNAST